MKKEQLIIPPKGGWKPRTYYQVEAAFNEDNPISGHLFFSGFLTGEGGGPGGYNGFPDTDPEDRRYTIKDVVYLKVIKKLFTAHDIEKCPNRDRMKSQLHAHSTHQP